MYESNAKDHQTAVLMVFGNTVRIKNLSKYCDPHFHFAYLYLQYSAKITKYYNWNHLLCVVLKLCSKRF